MTNNEYFDVNILRFKVKVVSPSGKQIEIDPLSQVIIDEDNVKGQIKLLPAQYAFFTAVYLDAKKAKDIAEIDLNKLKADRSKEIRAKFKKKNIKGEEKELSNKEVEEHLYGEEDIVAAEKKLVDLTSYASQCYYICEALNKKQISLGSLSYIQSQEKKVLESLAKDSLMDNSIQIDPNLFEKTKQGERKNVNE